MAEVESEPGGAIEGPPSSQAVIGVRLSWAVLSYCCAATPPPTSTATLALPPSRHGAQLVLAGFGAVTIALQLHHSRIAQDPARRRGWRLTLLLQAIFEYSELRGYPDQQPLWNRIASGHRADTADRSRCRA